MRGYQSSRTVWFDPRTSGYTLYAGIYGDSVEKPSVPKVVSKVAVKKAKAAAKGKGKQVGAKAKSKQVQAPDQVGQAYGSAGKFKGPSGVAPSKKLWAASIPLTGKAMALAGDVLFVSLADGRIVCMEPKK